MSDRPTFRDYLFHTENRYTKSGGRYFAIVKNKSRRLVWLMYSFFVVILITLMFLSLTDIIWSNCLGEVVLIAIPIYIFLLKLMYRRTQFITVVDNTDAWHKAAALKYSPSDRITTIVLNVLLILMLLYTHLPSGFVVSSIRSQLDGGGIVSAEFSLNGTGTFYKNDPVLDDTLLVPIPDPSGDKVWIYISVVHTPDIARLSLDGIPLPDDQQPYRIQNMFDLQNYFKQETYFRMSGNLLHDGSVLTLNCGSLIREWVFEVADEEAS